MPKSEREPERKSPNPGEGGEDLTEDYDGLPAMERLEMAALIKLRGEDSPEQFRAEWPEQAAILERMQKRYG